MSDIIFKITFSEGSFFKNLIDFITTCVDSTNKCWLHFLNTGIYLEQNCLDIKDKEKQTQFFTILTMSNTNFTEYIVKKEYSLYIEPKNIQRLCKNIKRKDKLILEFDEKYLYLIIPCQEKYETKSIQIDVSLQKLQEEKNYKTPDDSIKTIPFILPSQQLLNFKKGIGTKKEDVNVHIYENKFLKFDTHSQNIANMNVIYGNLTSVSDYENKGTKLKLNGNIFNMLIKLVHLTKQIKWYEKKEDVDDPLIKVSAILDNPNFMGEIVIFIYGIKIVE